jgi:dTDP-4-dehydrorhamnose reductase
VSLGAQPQVWITGAAGLIGNQLMRLAPPQWLPRAIARAELDLTDAAAVCAAFRRDQPQLVIHCAALSNTLVCERDPRAAWCNNFEVTQTLADFAADIPFILFSTDLVFDGLKGLYTETDASNPICVYAETKVAAERAVLANPRHTVIRTSLNAGRTRGGTAFNEQWLSALRQGKTLDLFVDEFRSPIAAAVTARAVWELVAANQPGLYHLAGGERLSRHAIGLLLAAREPEFVARIRPGSIRDFTAMRRSPDTSLNSGKIQRLLSFPLPGFSAWLREDPCGLEA